MPYRGTQKLPPDFPDPIPIERLSILHYYWLQLCMHLVVDPRNRLTLSVEKEAPNVFELAPFDLLPGDMMGRNTPPARVVVLSISGAITLHLCRSCCVRQTKCTFAPPFCSTVLQNKRPHTNPLENKPQHLAGENVAGRGNRKSVGQHSESSHG